MQVKEDEEHRVVLVDVSERGRRSQKFSGSAAHPGPTASMTTPSALTVVQVEARMCAEGFEMFDDGDGDGCGFFLLHPFEWVAHVLMTWFGV